MPDSNSIVYLFSYISKCWVQSARWSFRLNFVPFMAPRQIGQLILPAWLSRIKQDWQNVCLHGSISYGLWSKFKQIEHSMSISKRYKVSSIIFMKSPNLSKVSLQSPELVFSSIVNLFSKLSCWFPEIFQRNVFWRNFWVSVSVYLLFIQSTY